MRGYEWGKGTVRCSYCNKCGHNITSCSKIIPTANKCIEKMQKDPTYQPAWWEARALNEVRARKNRKTKSSNRIRRKPRCSFCNEEGHKRNTCKQHKDFIKLTTKANHNWRKAFVCEMLNLGYGIGSLVEVPNAIRKEFDFLNQGTSMGVVVGYNKEKLNVFCAYTAYSEFRSEGAVEILVENETMLCLTKRFIGVSDRLHGFNDNYTYYEVKPVQSVRGSVSNDFYITEEGDLSMKWFFKKISMKSKEYDSAIELIQKWAESPN